MNHIQVLVAEDIHPMRVLLRQMLRTMGITQTFEARDGSSALQLLRAQKIDLVLSDWNMTPMTGLQLLTAVRDIPDFASIPFIMITGERSFDRIEAARRHRVDGYLVKPFGMDVLKRQISRVLNRQIAA